MENKKSFFKKSIVIITILIISILGIIFYKNEGDEFIVYDESLLEEDAKIKTNSENVTNFEDSIQKSNKIKIYITGEVNNPGVKELEDGSRIEDAISIAGGLTNFANISDVNLAYTLEDGQKIYIPNVNEEITEYISTENGDGIVEESTTKNSGRVNINSADITQLCELPGVGESLASRIVAYREENGKYKSIEDLKNVTGIGEKKFESLKEYIVVK